MTPKPQSFIELKTDIQILQWESTMVKKENENVRDEEVRMRKFEKW